MKGKKVMRIFKAILSLKTPSDEGRELDFNSKKKDIIEAAEAFNIKYERWNKRIFVTEIEKFKISILLIKEVIDDKEVISPLEIGMFSKFLYHNKGWEKYSRETSKLFTSILFRESTDKGECLKLLSGVINKRGVSEIMDNIEKLRLADEKSSDKAESSVAPVNLTAENTDLNYENEISDELAIKTLDFLIASKNIGSKAVEKRNAINRIKEIIAEWLGKE